MYRLDETGDLRSAQVPARGQVRAPFEALVSVLGIEASGQTRWVVRRVGTEVAVLLRDDPRWGADALDGYRRRPWYLWRVNAADDRELRRFCSWLSRQVIGWAQKQPRPRELTADARDALNALLGQGQTMEQALVEVQAWTVPPDPAQLFAWPVHS